MDNHSQHHNHKETVKPKKKFSDFLPLVFIFAAIVIATFITLQYLEVATVMDALRFFMGYFFLVFGAFKAVKLKGFVEAYSTYDLIAMRSVAYGYVYPFIELGLAVFFLLGTFLVFANIITLIIMFVGALGVYLKLLKKEEIPCACLGVVFKIPMTHVTLFEDLLMAGMALIMLFML